MKKSLKYILLALGIFFLLYILGLVFQLPFVNWIWAWPKSPNLGLTFIASMFAGGGAALVLATVPTESEKN